MISLSFFSQQQVTQSWVAKVPTHIAFCKVRKLPALSAKCSEHGIVHQWVVKAVRFRSLEAAGRPSHEDALDEAIGLVEANVELPEQGKEAEDVHNLANFFSFAFQEARVAAFSNQPVFALTSLEKPSP